MHKIVFVTGNKGKFAEVRDILKALGIEVIQNKNGYPELQENELEPIAAYGAQHVANKLNMPVMVDDSGIFIKALNGFPGPYSRFVEDKLGNQKVLKLMEGEKLTEQRILRPLSDIANLEKSPWFSLVLLKGK